MTETLTRDNETETVASDATEAREAELVETPEKADATHHADACGRPDCCGGECREEPVSVRRPRVDAFADDERTVLLADVPGVDEGGLEVTLEKDVLTIAGTAHWPAPESFDRGWREFPRRRYERSFRLTDAVDRSAVTAVVRNGVLRVELPKSAEAKPTRIAVTAGA